jgi:hypothetical protein
VTARTRCGKSLVVAAIAALSIADLRAFAASGPDFNNDGYADLVIGTPFADGSSGVIHIVMGSASGLSPASPQELHVGLEGVPGNAKAGNQFGMGIAWSDFNGDGFDDLAVGVPNRRINLRDQAGCVFVFRGSAHGLSDQNVQLWHKNVAGVPNSVHAGELFGWTLAAADFNSDGFGDLAIGIPRQREPGKIDCGAVITLNGSAAGLQAAGSRYFSQDSLLMPGVGGNGHLFGYALTTGDFNGDGDADLAIGAPDDKVSLGALGSVTVLQGSLFGLTVVGAKYLNNIAMPVGVGPENQFGYALRSGDFNADGRDDLVVGCPFDNELTGRVVVVPGSNIGLSGSSAAAVFAATPSVRCLFGWSLTTGDLNDDGFVDVVCGAPLTDVLAADRAGMIHVMWGAPSGITSSVPQAWTQSDLFASASADGDDWMGMALTSADFDGDGADDLVVAAPFEDVNSQRDSGAVIITPGSAIGLASNLSQFWTQPSLGHTAVRDEAMGYSLMP